MSQEQCNAHSEVLQLLEPHLPACGPGVAALIQLQLAEGMQLAPDELMWPQLHSAVEALALALSTHQISAVDAAGGWRGGRLLPGSQGCGPACQLVAHQVQRPVM